MRSDSPVFRPSSQWRAMNALAEAGAIVAAIDNSDGLLPSLEQLSAANALQIEVNVTKMTAGVASSEGCPEELAVRSCFGWGDWNVVAIVENKDVDRAAQIARDNGSQVTAIGVCRTDRSASVVLRRGERSIIAPRLESERFAHDSWFSQGIESYVESLSNLELP